MATIHKVNAALLDTKADEPRQLSAREMKRLALERVLARAIKGAAQDGGRVAYRLILDKDDRLSTLKAAFKRVKQAEGQGDVNLLTVGDVLFVARRAQMRGRRPRSNNS